MPTLPGRILSQARLGDFWEYIFRHLNFYRIHLLFFTFTPLIFSGIFYAANGQYHVDYIDCLYNCVSAITVCGLATVDLSGLTPFQQALLFIQMCLGSPVVISWTMVYIRRSFFARKFQRIVEAELARNAARELHRPVDVKIEPWWRKLWTMLKWERGTRLRSFSDISVQEIGPVKARGRIHLRPDMIRRVEGAPKLVDPSGWISEGVSDQPGQDNTAQNEKIETDESRRTSAYGESSSTGHTDSTEVEKKERPQTQDPQNPPATRGPQLVHTQTVEFAAPPAPHRRTYNIFCAGHMSRPTMSRPTMSRPTMSRPTMSRPTMSRPTMSRPMTMPRTGTITTGASHAFPPRRTMHKGFGGFPMPHELISRLFGRAFPSLERKLTRTITMPRTRTIASERGTVGPGARPVPYISFEAVVGRNSVFQSLTREQLEELGGVEYRALSALLWIVGAYHIGLQLLAFVIIAPYMSIARWREDFVPPALHKPVSSTWYVYSAFQVVSSYTNTGMSLVDESLVPFQRAYPMILCMIILILAGNTAFVHYVFRCDATDWFFFLVLDIGNPAIANIPLGVRFIIGLLQATAVRAAGFGTVTLAALAPAVKVLYVIMMYVSVYPIAMSVRSTNVYEEKSLGVFPSEEELSPEDAFSHTGNRATVWGRYLAMHARKQLSFDMWWLGTALFLVCIIEKNGLEDEASNNWFTIFTVVFELVSAYGTVGLSLGVPYANYSFSGALRPLSKLIICAVMLRGRHRGLPVAIDRAVMLPYEYKHDPQDGYGEENEGEYAMEDHDTAYPEREWVWHDPQGPEGDGSPHIQISSVPRPKDLEGVLRKPEQPSGAQGGDEAARAMEERTSSKQD
ncbi:TrkH-domain-containing protein [Trametes versicolor FP-101664 SS1]|uniref:TrkH-domain-containing protein n=1 Tax=Trametes versicolor (strain FP-101664) TaxID=717944 RepID=UPI000462166F|nr:TrkH-domain-containing protein [Trametes versicolor FP-101664 SS1]EIW54439.1 TrkH-domain-containing protein [Trametes versicolor FP-101664 SS1]